MYHPQAAELNQTIESSNPSVLRLLSNRGRAIYFPSRGIIQQSADAKSAAINATIGVALEDDGSPLALPSLRTRVNVPPENAFNYAPPFGRPELRAAWEKALRTKNPSLGSTAISKPVVTSALTHGLSLAGYLFVNEGDEIILPDLYWENYDLVYGITYGARLRTFPMFDGNRFNVAGLRSELIRGTPGKRLVLLNFPNNPTGYTATVEEGRMLREVLIEAADRGRDIAVLIDDAYFGLVYEDGVMTESMFALLADAHERILAVKFDGPTKEDYVWGFRVGFVTFACARNSPAMYDALEKKLAGAIRATISNVSNLSQSLLSAAYADPDYPEQKRAAYGILRRRYEEIRSLLAAHHEYQEVMEPLPFNSGYFMCLKMRPHIDTEALRRRLLSQYSSGVIALGPLVRIAFSSTPREAIPKLFENIYRAARETSG